jgi:DNA-binding NtrC family response regulator
MSARILFVDDDPNLLAACARSLRKRFLVHTAPGAAQGLAALAEQSFSVVVSDFRMPVLDGLRFLARVQERSPDTVRILLSGNLDRATALAAVADGRIFRYLAKPCDAATMTLALAAGIASHRDAAAAGIARVIYPPQRPMELPPSTWQAPLGVPGGVQRLPA